MNQYYLDNNVSRSGGKATRLLDSLCIAAYTATTLLAHGPF